MNAFLSRLPLRGKLALIAAMSVLMLLIPTALYALRSLQSLQQLQHEAQGLQPGAEILQTTRLAAQHRGLSNGALNGDTKAAAQRAEAWTALQALRATSTQALQGLGDATLDKRLAAFWTEQQALAEAVAAGSLPAPESFGRHTKLIEQQLALLYDLTVRSELVLHPIVAGYFLQDAALNHLPVLNELLGRLRGSGMGLLAKGALTPADRMHLAILLERAEQASMGAQRAVTLAGQDNAAVSKALSGVLAGAQAAMAETTAAARKQLIEPEAPGIDATAWWAATTRTIDAHFKLGDTALATLQTDLQAAVDSEQRTLATVGAALLLLAGLGGWLLWAVAVQTTRSIEQAIGLAQAVAAGDLTHRVAVSEGARDEGAQLIRALDLMSRQLGSVVGAVRDNAGQVATASAEIAQGNQDLSSRTESQASALEQTAASMEELRTTIGHSADSARQASQLAHSASEVASRGGLAVGEVAATMLQIKQSSHRIAEIIGTIDGIAFQTNILALNAAVEAARAGEQGRGFAVVASEVRALAQRSASAAREIRTLITASVERVEQGSQQGAGAAATMAEVVQSVKRVADLIGEVSAATQEQNSGVAQVTEAVTQMDHATQQNAALVEESAAAAESLRQQAEALLQAVAVFRGGHAAA